jgi:23S rRNA (guanine2445-N2)-methyltransferase / 23S rRNA (guanine2069-N7)-methyltransferase
MSNSSRQDRENPKDSLFLDGFYASAPMGAAHVLARELAALGVSGAREKGAGVWFPGKTEAAYRALLWSRVASRVLVPLAAFDAASPEELYAGARDFPWEEHTGPDDSIAMEAVVRNSAVSHSQYAALKVKDAVCDRFRDQYGRRPPVDVKAPGLRVHIHIHRDRAELSADLSGDSLHRRGYREEGVRAPLKENLAAAVLYMAGWPETAAAGGGLADPMCGSGTFVIEGALMAADVAPGLARGGYGSPAWLGHVPRLWGRLFEEARERARKGLLKTLPVAGADKDPSAVAAARKNRARAGLEGKVRLLRRDIRENAPLFSKSALPGLVVVNPPYGDRLGGVEDLPALYALLGAHVKACYPGWRMALFSGAEELCYSLGLRAHKINRLYNGPIPSVLLRFEIGA